MLVRLSDLLSLQKKSKFKANFGQKSGKFKFFTCSPTQDKFIDEFIFDQESLIIGTGGAASIHYCNEPFATSTDCLVLYAKSTNNFNIKYIYYYLKGKKDVLQKGFHGSGLQHISKNYVLNITVNLPSLEQQNFIVKYFDSIENIQTNTDKCILDMELLIKSQFIEMFGDLNRNTKNLIFVPLSNLFKIGSSKRVYERDWKDSGVPFYRAREIVKLSLDGYVNNDLFISEEMYESYSKKFGVPRPGDIMCTGVGTLGVCYLVKPDDRFYYKDGNIICFHSQNLANSRFILECFNTPFVKNQISSTSSGSTVGTYTIDRACQTLVPLPDRTEQDSFASFVNQIDKSKIIVFIGAF